MCLMFSYEKPPMPYLAPHNGAQQSEKKVQEMGGAPLEVKIWGPIFEQA